MTRAQVTWRRRWWGESMTIDEWEKMTLAIVVNRRRKQVAEFRKRAETAGRRSKLFAPSRSELLADAAIAQWEADTIERDGGLPADYMALLP